MPMQHNIHNKKLNTANRHQNLLLKGREWPMTMKHLGLHTTARLRFKKQPRRFKKTNKKLNRLPPMEVRIQERPRSAAYTTAADNVWMALVY